MRSEEELVIANSAIGKAKVFHARRSRCLLVLLLIGASLELLANVSFGAGMCYTAVPVPDTKGKAMPIEPVCRGLEENLNAFCDEPPVVCGLRVAPKFASEFTFPAWQPVALDGGLDLVESIVRAQWPSSASEQVKDDVWKDYRAVLAPALAGGRLTVASADLDLFQLDRAYKTYRIDAGNCAQLNAHLSKEPKRIWWNMPLKYAQLYVMPAPEAIREIESKYRNLEWRGAGGDIFLFRGKPYAYFMAGNQNVATGPINNQLVVKEGVNDSPGGALRTTIRDVCYLNYNYTAPEVRNAVVQPGTVIVTLVPLREPLLAEVSIENQDIGFVAPKQPVRLKLAAYQFQKYGMLDGVVQTVSADASEQANSSEAKTTSPPSNGTVFKALIELKRQELDANGLVLPLAAGMQVSAEILQGKRTVLEYLLSPVQRIASEAGMER